MNLVTPEFGLIFWMILSFTILVLILKKAAWKPILKALKDREDKIDHALEAAEEAKEQMAQLKADNEKIINEARVEKDSILKEAKDIKDQIIREARDKAGDEADKMINEAKQKIRAEKTAAIDEIKAQIAGLSIEIAEKLLQEELKDKAKQNQLVKKHIDDIRLN